MNVKSSSRVFRFVFFFGCGSIVRLLDCLTISAVYGESDVEFTCVISPYNNIQQWKIGSGVVAGCGAVSCSEEASNPARYSFTPNRTSGIFIFKIDSINSTDDKTIVGCFDGIDTKTLAIDFSDQISSISNTTSATVNNNPSESDEPANNELFSLLVLLVVILVIIIMICVRPKFKIDLKDTEIDLLWTDRLNCCLGCQLIFGYHIVCNPIKGQVTDTICRKYYTKKNYYTLRDLDPMAIYEISLSRKLCCFKSSAAIRYVITRKQGMPNDQGYDAMSTSIGVWWTKPDCINNLQLKYQVTCNEDKKENTDETESTITSLVPITTYKIEVFAIDNKKDCLLFAEEIATTDLKVEVNPEDVCYQPGGLCVECNIKWTVEDFIIPERDIVIPEHLHESSNLYFDVICYSEKQVVDEKKKIRVSSYTIPKLYPNRSYSVYVYPVYHSVTFTPAMIVLTTPYKPTKLKPTEVKSTVIDVTWKKPDYTNGKRLEYKVFCNKELVSTTSETSCKIKNLEPSQKYDIQIFTIINKEHELESLPLQRTIKTQPSEQVPFPEI